MNPTAKLIITITILVYYLNYLIKLTIFTTFFVTILHFLAPQLFSSWKSYYNYYTYQLNYLIEYNLTYISKTMGVTHFTSMLLKGHKLFLFVWLFGNFAAYVGFITSFNSDWEVLFIWSFAVCFIIYIYWISFFFGQLLNKWINDYKIPLTIGFILIFFIELLSIIIRTFSLTTRLAINTFAGALYLIILNKLIFTTTFSSHSFFLNLFGYFIINYLIIVILSELIKISGQCLLFLALSFYYLSESEC